MGSIYENGEVYHINVVESGSTKTTLTTATVNPELYVCRGFLLTRRSLALRQ